MSSWAEKKNSGVAYGFSTTQDGSSNRAGSSGTIAGAGSGAVPSPPAQPRKGSNSRPVLSARSTSSANGVTSGNGPLVASVLGNYVNGYHNQTVSPGPQRVLSSPQHAAATQRSASASLQRASSGRHRSATSSQGLQSKPLFVAYGMQYSNHAAGRVAAGSGPSSVGLGARGSVSMSPYRTRPASSTALSTGGAGLGATSAAAAAAAAATAANGRPSSSQLPTRQSGDNWFGNTKLSVTLPGGSNEGMRAVHELGHLLSVFSPTSPGSGGGAAPMGPKATASSFRASKYMGGGPGMGPGMGNYKEAWGSGGGAVQDGGVPMGASGGGAGSSGGAMGQRPMSAVSNANAVVTKPSLMSYMGADGRAMHGQAQAHQSANLSLMRLQQQQQQLQQQQAGSYGSNGGVTVAMQQQGPSMSAAATQLANPGAQHLHTTTLTFQSGAHGSSSGGAPGHNPLRVSMTLASGASPVTSPKEFHGASPHSASSPHGAHGHGPPMRPWDTPAGAYQMGHSTAHGSATPVRSGIASVASSQQHITMAALTAQGGPREQQDSPVGAPGGPASAGGAYNTPFAASHAPYAHAAAMPMSTTAAVSQALHSSHLHAQTAPASLAFASAMAAAASAVLNGTHQPAAAHHQQPQHPSVPTAAGPVTQPPHAALPPAPHSAPLHNAPAPGSVSKAVREALLLGATSSGGIPSPTSSSSFQANGPMSSAPTSSSATAPGGIVGPSGALNLNLRASSVLANAPHPVGLPPPSPMKAAPPPPAGAPPSRTFMRSSSSRSSNGSGTTDQLPYYNSGAGAISSARPAAGEDRDRDGGGADNSSGVPSSQQQQQTPTRSVLNSHTSHQPGASGHSYSAVSSALAAAAASDAAGTAPASPAAAYGHASSNPTHRDVLLHNAHVSWGTTASAAPQGSAPGTPTRPYGTGAHSDLAARRASTGSNLAFLDSVTSGAAGVPGTPPVPGSPFARGPDGHSRMLVEHGTLTCIRPSTVPSNFAADSQPDLSMFADVLMVSPSRGSGSEPVHPSGGSMTAGGGSGSVTVTGMAPPSPARGMTGVAAGSGSGAATYPGPSWNPSSWRRSVDGFDLPQQQQGASGGSVGSGSGAGAGAGAAAATGGTSQQQQQHQASSGWSAARDQGEQRERGRERDRERERERDSTPTRTYPHSSSSSASAAAASAVASAAASAAAGAAAAASAADAAPASSSASAPGQGPSSAPAASTPSPHPVVPTPVTQPAISMAALQQAALAGRGGSGHGSNASSRAGSVVGGSDSGHAVPLPSDQPLRPRSPYTTTHASSGTTSTSTHAHAAAAGAATPAAGVATGTCSSSAATASGASSGTASTSSSAATSATSTTTTTSASGEKTTTTPQPATASTTAPTTSTAAAASSTSSSSTAAAAAAAVAAVLGSQQAGAGSSTARSGSSTSRAVAPSSSSSSRFNPASVLGGDPDPNYLGLLPGYSVGKVIGEGGFCQVRLAVHHLSQRKVAVKVIDKAKLTDPNEAKRMQREIRVMKHLSHQCVIKLFEVIDSPKNLFLVMEHAPSGSLLDYVRGRKRLSEADACVFFQQIVASLEYCHAREVVHRDIKLENILLDAEQRMKLIDFGLSAFFVPGKRLRVHCGSPSYAAPEIVARKAYEGPPVDVWSLGVVLFAMVAGYLPFHASGGNKQELCNKIMAGQYTAPEWLSPAMKDLLARMLTTDPDKRITFQQVWQHSWVRNGPQWHERGVNVYALVADPNSPGGVRGDEQVLAELEAAGYARASVLQHLGAGETSHLTASYFLLCEGKAEAMRRLRSSGSSSSSRGSSTRSAPASVAGQGQGTSSAAAAAASPHAASKSRQLAVGESPIRGASPAGGGHQVGSSRPGTAAGASTGAGAGGGSFSRGHRPQPGEEGGGAPMFIGAGGRTAVAV